MHPRISMEVNPSASWSVSPSTYTHTRACKHAQTRRQNYRESGAAMAKDIGHKYAVKYIHTDVRNSATFPAPSSLPIPSPRHPLPLAISKVEKTRFRAFGKNGLRTDGPMDEPTDGQTLI